AVVLLPDRTYPGVVVQGDTLNELRKQAIRLQYLVNERNIEGLMEEVKELNEVLSDVQLHFERVCAERGIGLPY
ncbi:DUF6959 family protein, partial [Gemmatimonas sp.]|uniref:DUF6959 family protein n=1 Tax=Gemmatimonas sp. TaxID=1962908 RepID=UPI00391F2E0B